VQQGNVGLEAATSKELTEAGISGTLGKRDCPRTAPGKPIVSFGVKAHPCFFLFDDQVAEGLQTRAKEESFWGERCKSVKCQLKSGSPGQCEVRVLALIVYV
jgi:hypothetical protein